MKEFSWGKVIERFNYDFDGVPMEVTKYNPWERDGISILTGTPNLSLIEYHCEEIHEASASLQYLLISWIAYKNLGNNQHVLVSGLSKALGIVPYY